MTRGYRTSPYLALRPGGRGDVTASHVVWRAPGGGSYTASMVAYQGLLYLTNDVGVLTCADMKTGERVWQTRLDGVFFASPVAADGKVYFPSQTGETIVVKAGRTPDILARNDLGVRSSPRPHLERCIFGSAPHVRIGQVVEIRVSCREACRVVCLRTFVGRT